MDPIILASSSPRRQEILKKLNIPFVVHPAEIEEIYPPDTPVENVPEYLAIKKVDHVVKKLSKSSEIGWVLGADTIIVFDGKIYGKPADFSEAEKFIRLFQGKTHKVITAVVLYNGALHDFSTRTSITEVTFASMTDEEINAYLETGEWHGAAGAYRIQENASCFIKEIKGTESSVTGLPIHELYDILREQGYNFTIQ